MTNKNLSVVAGLLFAGAIGCSSTEKNITIQSEPDPVQSKQKLSQDSATESKSDPDYFRIPPEQHTFQDKDVIQTGRYTAIVPTPTPEQKNILDVIITVTLPEHDISTVGQGVRYLLRRSGYQLVKSDLLPTDVLLLFSRPLPSIHRHLGPMPLRDALNTLATPAFTLAEDPVHRLISFQYSKNIIQE